MKVVWVKMKLHQNLLLLVLMVQVYSRVLKSNVTTKIHKSWVPFNLDVCCFSHQINLDVETLLAFPLVHQAHALF